MVTKEELEKDYTDATSAGKALGISSSRMSRLCSAGRFEGAFKFGAVWVIPREAIESYIPRRRGARPKNLAVEPPTEEPKPKTAKKTAAKKADGAKPVEAKAEPAPAKRRGRPRKVVL